MEEEKQRPKYFTEHGEYALKTVLKNLKEMVWTQDNFPFKTRFVGFPTMIVHSREELIGRIKNMNDIVSLIDSQKEEKDNGNKK